MRFCQIRLPFALLFCLLSCPLVSWADQTQPDQTASSQTMQAQNTQSQDMVAMSDDSVYYTDEQPAQMGPISHPIDQAYVVPVDNTDQPTDPSDPSSTAVAPEPSSMVLLTTGLLLGGILWAQQRS